MSGYRGAEREAAAAGGGMPGEAAGAAAALATEHVTVHYGTRLAVAPTTLTLAAGGISALVGPNGAGKSSLLKAVAGLMPHGGRVRLNGVTLEELTPTERARRLAYLPQAPSAHWPMTVRDLVALGRLPHRAFGRAPGPEDGHAVHRAMAQTDIAGFAERRISELSGGERTRVLLARALAVGAPVLLVDEPIASLDPYHQLQIMSVLQAYAEDGALVVAVLHDLSLAARFCARMILMDEGRVVGDGLPEQVLTKSALRRHYHVDPYLARHEEQPVVVPWTRLD